MNSLKAVKILILTAIISMVSINVLSEEIGDSLKADTIIDTTKIIDTADSNIAIDTSVTSNIKLIDTNILIPLLDFSGVSLFDALSSLARAYTLSLYIDSSVIGKITLRLENVSLNDAMLFIIKEYHLEWDKTGEIVKIFKPVPPLPVPEPLNIKYENDLLSIDVKDADLERFVNSLIDLTGRNIILENNIRGKVSGKLSNLELEKALEVVLPANGFVVKNIDSITYISIEATENQKGGKRQNLTVTCKENLITLEASNVALSNVLSSISSECGINLFLNSVIEGTITASFQNKSIEDALTYILLDSKYSFKETGGVYFVGPKESEGLYDSKLIKLKHLRATNLLEMIPVSLSKQLTIKVVKEHNGLLLTGPRTSIVQLQAFMDEIDIPVAQVLFEVIVVDYSTTDRAEFNITANNFGGDSGLPGKTYYPNIDLSASGDQLNDNLRSLESHLGISNLGTLPDNFFARLKFMQQEGIANVRSHPQIATLNGYPASIQIGTTQYYLLESQTIYPSQQSSISTQTSQRFETINADMSLEVTPYVNKDGGLIVEVAPEFNTPAQSFDPDIPPTINRRILKSTVKLKNGETIVLGGLIQETDSKTINKVPILGSIPILGRLFQNRTTSKNQSELMIYITPHVYYGSEGAVDVDSILKKK